MVEMWRWSAVRGSGVRWRCGRRLESENDVGETRRDENVSGKKLKLQGECQWERKLRHVWSENSDFLVE